MKLMRIFSMLLAMFLPVAASAFANPFERSGTGPGVLMAEVACYGDHELKPLFFETFRDELADALQNTTDFDVKFSLGMRKDELFSRIHMDTIAYGPLYRRECASARMASYADAIFGRDYFWDDAKLEMRRKNAGKPYRISPEMTEAVREIGAAYGVDYLLFCNLRDADTRLKHSIFNAHVARLDERPKKITVESEYHLVDAKTGAVYEGHILSDKTGQILSLLGRFGKAATVQNLLQCMFEVQADRIVNDMQKRGMKALEKAL